MKTYKGFQKGLLFGFVIENGVLEINIACFWMMISLREL